MITFLTYECQLRSETDPIVIETLTRKGWVETPQPPYDPTTQTCTWQDCQWVINQIVIPIPQIIPNWSLRAQLQIIGLFDNVQTMIDNLTGTEKIVAVQQWEYGNQVERNHPLVIQIGTELGLTSEQIDQIFTDASNLS